MTEKKHRRPFRNFFIKKSLQFKMTLKIFLAMFLSGLLTLGVLVLVYDWKSQHGSYYYMSNDIRQDLQLLELQSILGTILPPILAVELVGVTIAFLIGLISSRKMAVPIYKIEKWANRLRNGKLKAELAFRNEDHLDDLTTQCNGVTDFFRKTVNDISEHADAISYNPENVEFVKEHTAAIKKLLDKMEY
ncbi:MAG TPA: hypothetical protein VHO70_05740 [Chitinispirillaceae bacterium]|nr:hypothetical protein [Chitinispirillaceae bacterium]